MLIRICFVVILLTGNASWVVAQQQLSSANLANPVGKVPLPLSWGEVDQQLRESCLLQILLNDNQRAHGCSHHDTPFMLQYEWKLNRNEVGASTVPSNRETWTEFALVRQVTLPSKIEREKTHPERRYRFRGNYHYPQSPWFSALACRYPINQPQEDVVRYQLTKEPSAITSQYEGTITCVPVITARAKTIEALEAKLLEMYCDYITQMVEEDTLLAVATTKSSNSLEHAPIGWWDLPAAYRFR